VLITSLPVGIDVDRHATEMRQVMKQLMPDFLPDCVTVSYRQSLRRRATHLGVQPMTNSAVQPSTRAW
jgi:hypothetical protein